VTSGSGSRYLGGCWSSYSGLDHTNACSLGVADGMDFSASRCVVILEVVKSCGFK